ncbi:MAG: FHA domain-containing protein [Myxococcales bacterium]|nr:FHA domain-containing protein [Myxococcales bacterium]
MHPSVGRLTVPLPPEQPLVLGRFHPENTVQVGWDVRISRRHACIAWRGGVVWIEDLGSRNGTWVGGRRIAAPDDPRPRGICARR